MKRFEAAFVRTRALHGYAENPFRKTLNRNARLPETVCSLCSGISTKTSVRTLRRRPAFSRTRLLSSGLCHYRRLFSGFGSRFRFGYLMRFRRFPTENFVQLRDSGIQIRSGVM